MISAISKLTSFLISFFNTNDVILQKYRFFFFFLVFSKSKDILFLSLILRNFCILHFRRFFVGLFLDCLSNSQCSKIKYFQSNNILKWDFLKHFQTLWNCNIKRKCISETLFSMLKDFEVRYSKNCLLMFISVQFNWILFPRETFTVCVVLCALYHSRRRHARERIHFLKNRLEPQHYIGSLLMMMILWFSFLFFSNLALVQ